MLLDSVIIILREVLEAAIICSLLLAMSHHKQYRITWLVPGALLGACGAIAYAINLSMITEAFDYTGQEWINTLLHLLLFLCALVLFGIPFNRPSNVSPSALWWLLCITVALALVREGAEILIYYQGLIDTPLVKNAFIGGAIGTSIGISVGILLYFFISQSNQAFALRTTQLMLAVVTAGMVSQSVTQLEQVDIIPNSPIIWDSSYLLPENSVTGQMLYAVLGYEATPSLWQIVIHLFCLASFVVYFFYLKAKN